MPDLPSGRVTFLFTDIEGSTNLVQKLGASDYRRLLTDLGRHRLKDLVEPEHLFQLVAPGLQDDFPLIRTIDTRPKYLPAQRTSFIGRDRELGEVADLVGGSRIVTLTGPGGSGKTRLAVAVADRLLPRFDDGVFFIPLAPIDDPEQV